MTKREVTWATAIAVAAVAALVAGHLQLPVAGSWSLNRILHYGWFALTGAAGAAGLAAFLWPRAKARRRDFERQRARQRVICVIGVVVLTFGLIALGEVRRDGVTRGCLKRAEEDLAAIQSALEAYAAAHDGARPANLADLVPEYLAADRLYYRLRSGPVEVPPGPASKDEEPSYVLVPGLPAPADRREEKRQEGRFLVVQRPGQGWAPLVAALGRQGRLGLIGDDDARRIIQPPESGPQRGRR